MNDSLLQAIYRPVKFNTKENKFQKESEHLNTVYKLNSLHDVVKLIL